MALTLLDQVTDKCEKHDVVVYRDIATFSFFAKFQLGPVKNNLKVCLMISSALNNTFAQMS